MLRTLLFLRIFAKVPLNFAKALLFLSFCCFLWAPPGFLAPTVAYISIPVPMKHSHSHCHLQKDLEHYSNSRMVCDRGCCGITIADSAMVCDRDGLWSLWFVIAASLWARWFVSAMVCDRGGFGEFVSAVICDRCGLWPQWVCWISFSRVVLGAIASTLKWLWFTCVWTKSGNVWIPW